MHTALWCQLSGETIHSQEHALGSVKVQAAAVRCEPLPQKGYPGHPYHPWCLLFAYKPHSANLDAKADVKGSWRAVVLKSWLQSYLEGSLKQKPSGPIPRVSESVGLGWWEPAFAFLMSSQVMLRLLLLRPGFENHWSVLCSSDAPNSSTWIQSLNEARNTQPSSTWMVGMYLARQSPKSLIKHPFHFTLSRTLHSRDHKGAESDMYFVVRPVMVASVLNMY